jgi:hypothetical protein
LRTEFLQLNFKFAIVAARFITRSTFAENTQTKAAYLPEDGSNDSTKKAAFRQLFSARYYK